ncbi:signal peptidase I [Nocardioides sp. cx-169]|uniref:signal peptidase I n=1 Tax=Nocardioides sp. cx-169 TaxID=2899080 RepID=UPI001E5FF135|nr:signal peptidase I [Nocardioides sp. cx-169]MCD4535497.1 signal peptidase I [Nocardioides sp. cx-169]
MSNVIAAGGRHRAVPTTRSAVTPVTRPAPSPPSSALSADGPGAGSQPPRRPGLLRRLVSLLLSLLMVVSMVAFLFLAIGPHVLGYRTSTMLTGSMEPDISPGDVVVTAPRPAADIKVGDVISYQIPIEDHRVETHRITEVDRAADGTISIRTKGDANPNVDPWTAVLEEDTVWEVQAVVPEVGHVIRAMRSPVVHHVVKWVAVGGLILLGLTSIWGRSNDDEDETVDA